MPLDHYISQVHLKKFYSPMLGDRMYAMRKSDLKSFTPNAKGVCRINEGSTNAYLTEDRVIEEFLKTIEPNYNVALTKLISGSIDNDGIYTIAGFVAYVMSCSPAGMRIQSGPLKGMAETTMAMMDARGLFPPSPPELGGKSLTEHLRAGTVEVTVDRKFPQAIGINSILRYVALFGNFKWDILVNDFDDSPFFTSDFPVAIERTEDPRILNRIVPLAPNLAVRIRPDLAVDKNRPDFSFANFSNETRKISRKELVKINYLIVRCAEDAVFYRDDCAWVKNVIAENRYYRIEPITHKLPTDNGVLLVFSQRVVTFSPPTSRGR